MSAPPPYSSRPPSTSSTQRISPADVATLFADLSISVSPTPHPSSAPGLAPGLSPVNDPPTSQDVNRLYSYYTPATESFTDSWDAAASQTQGIPGGSPQRLTPNNTPNKAFRFKKGGFAIFHGRQKGAFCYWHEVAPLVIGVSNSLYQGYPTFELARAAFEYALERGWTRICGSRPSIPTSISATTLSSLPAPIGLLDAPNPLHAGGVLGGKWHIVYSGISPGVYQSRQVPLDRAALLSLTVSSLECSLNTRGLSCATYDSCTSRATAVLRFQNALDAGRVIVLAPVYTA
ncbi:hypothetical protein C8R43DRAFT_1143620 [Mycena crocata]|nr:hypothetical protein C8R43DRAFT_1143620 [Mycena crocata]